MRTVTDHTAGFGTSACDDRAASGVRPSELLDGAASCGQGMHHSAHESWSQVFCDCLPFTHIHCSQYHALRIPRCRTARVDRRSAVDCFQLLS